MRSLPMALALLCAPAHAGLFGNDAPGRIPIPAKEISATVEDEAGVQVQLTRFSFDGEVYFFGNLGKAQVTVPFDEVATARFDDTGDEDWVDVTVTTRAGDEVTIRVESDRPCYGKTHFGNYRIEAADLRTVTVGG